MDIKLAIVQKAGRNLKRGSRVFGGGEATVGGTGGGDTSVLGVRVLEPFPAGSLEWIVSSVSPEINFFILLDSF
jgi:hypothetical protein